MIAAERETPDPASKVAGPHVIVLAGPNGAGKSTLAPHLLRDELGVATFVNADEIARGLAGFAPELQAVRAGRIMQARLKELIQSRLDFAFESTLSGLGLRRTLDSCRQLGYRVDLVYLWLPSADVAVERVRHRVLAGGHDVPESDIRRRWKRSLLNLFDTYISLSTSWRVYDGAAEAAAAAVARGAEGMATTIIDPVRWSRVRQIVRQLREEA